MALIYDTHEGHTLAQGDDRTLLERFILWIHDLPIFGKRYHPYLLMMDLALAASVVNTFAFAGRFPELSAGRFLVAFALVYAVYELGFINLKRRLTGTASRSLIVDFLVFIIPAQLLFARILGLPVAAAADLFGLNLALVVCWVRVGCFFGGCCYGKRSNIGIVYPREIFRTLEGCRNYTPGQAPQHRVFPVQLVDSAANLIAFLSLWSYLNWAGAPTGRATILYFSGYCLVRCFLDLAREVSIYKRRGPFTVAQILGSVIAVAGVITLAAVGIR